MIMQTPTSEDHNLVLVTLNDYINWEGKKMLRANAKFNTWPLITEGYLLSEGSSMLALENELQMSCKDTKNAHLRLDQRYIKPFQSVK